MKSIECVSIQDILHIDELKRESLLQSEMKAIQVNVSIKNIDYSSYLIESNWVKTVQGLDVELICMGRVRGEADYSPFNVEFSESASSFGTEFPLRKGEASEVSYIVFAEKNVERIKITSSCFEEDSVLSKAFSKNYVKIYVAGYRRFQIRPNFIVWQSLVGAAGGP